MSISNNKKIIIIGDASRGKTTFALKLARKLKIKCYSTDDFYWKTKYTKKANKQTSINNIKKIFKKKSWIVEGTTKHLLEPGLSKTEKIIYLKHKSFLTQLYLLFKRYLKRPNERLIDFLSLCKHLFYKRYKLGYKKNVISLEELVKPYKNKLVYLDSFQKIDEFLNKT